MKCLTSLLGVTGIVVFSFVSHAQTTSVKSGKWSSPSTWSDGIVPDVSAGAIIINHNVDVPEDTVLIVDELIVNATLTINKHAKLLLENGRDASPDLLVQSGRLEIRGQLTCLDSSIIAGTTASNTFFNDSSIYEHQYFSIAGEPPTATWATTSTLEITGFTTGKSLSSLKWNQQYGNVTYNCRSQRSGTFVEMLGNIQNVKGNFLIQDTGAGVLRVTLDKTALTTINIGGNFFIEGRSRVWLSRNGNTRINVNGDFHYQSNVTASSYLTTQGNGELNILGNMLVNTVGILRFASSGVGRGTITLGKNLDLPAGTLTLTAPGQGKIIMNGQASQTLNLKGNVTTGINIEIANSNGVTGAPNSKTSGNILIKSGGKMILPSGIFSLQGDLGSEVGGEISADNGTLQLTGSVNQTIQLSNDTLHHLTVNKLSGSIVTIGAPLILNGVLTVLTSGVTILSGGNLTLRSSTDAALLEGTIASLPAGSFIDGNVTVQRFMSGEGRIYRYLSSPITNGSVAQWQDDFPVTGTFDDPSTGSGLNSSGPSLFYYDEQVANDGWINYPASGAASENPIVPGRGYAAFIRKASGPTTWDVTGVLNQHDLNFPITYTQTSDTLYDGWNLIGNPYPSPIDWDNDAGWSKLNVEEKIAVRDNGTGTFKYWDGSVGNLGSGVIAIGQAFWIQATGNTPSLTIRESAKTNTPGIFYRARNTEVDFIRLSLVGSRLVDETFLRLEPEASPSYDKRDVVKWLNDQLNFSFVSGSIPLAIDVRDRVTCNESIPLVMKFTRRSDGSFNPAHVGEYSLTLTSAGLFEYSDFELKDHFIDSIFSLKDTPYRFAITADPQSYDSARFTLSISTAVLPDESKLTFDSLVCDSSPDPAIKLTDVVPGTRYDCWLNGLLITSVLTKNDSMLTLALSKTNLSMGANKVHLISRNVCGELRTQTLTISKVNMIDAPVLKDMGLKISSSYDHGRWYLNGEKIAEDVASITPDVSGKYQNEIEINGCRALAEIEFAVQENSWKCFPSPTLRFVTITAPIESKIYEVALLTPGGAIVKKVTLANGEKEMVIDTLGLVDGLYIAKVKTNTAIKVMRFIKRSE